MIPVVSLVRYKDISSVAQAIELCNGFRELKPAFKVLLKPNILASGKGKFPPFGVVTTTKVIEGVVRALKDFGVDNISIGEGPIFTEYNKDTMEAYEWLNIHKLAKRYGIKLIDFNMGPYRKITNEDVSMNIAVAALETDFFINLPVLKTHCATQVSLACKNLKGCLNTVSRKRFHGENGKLHYCISRLAEIVPQHLVLIDGIYAMERGPEPCMGTAHPRGVLAASTDFLAADVIGTRLLGGKPKDINHLKLYAERNKKVAVLEDQQVIEICGERLEDHIEYLPWEYRLDFIRDSGHTGLEVKLVNDTTCSGCGGNVLVPLILLIALSCNHDFGGLRVVVGKGLKDNHNSSKTLLFGDCAIKENKHLDKATKIEGCPPPFIKTCSLFINQIPTLSGKFAFFSRLALFLVKLKMGIGVIPLPRYERYKDNPLYDIRHFTD